MSYPQPPMNAPAISAPQEPPPIIPPSYPQNSSGMFLEPPGNWGMSSQNGGGGQNYGLLRATSDSALHHTVNQKIDQINQERGQNQLQPPAPAHSQPSPPNPPVIHPLCFLFNSFFLDKPPTQTAATLNATRSSVWKSARFDDSYYSQDKLEAFKC